MCTCALGQPRRVLEQPRSALGEPESNNYKSFSSAILVMCLFVITLVEVSKETHTQLIILGPKPLLELHCLYIDNSASSCAQIMNYSIKPTCSLTNANDLWQQGNENWRYCQHYVRTCSVYGSPFYQNISWHYIKLHRCSTCWVEVPTHGGIPLVNSLDEVWILTHWSRCWVEDKSDK